MPTVRKKVIFLRDYSPRKKGEVVTFEGYEGVKTADWYIANKVAKECECKKGEDCPECEKRAQEAREKKAAQNAKTTITPKDDNKEPELAKLSKDMNATDAIKIINKLAENDPEKIEAFTKGDNRKTVKSAVEKLG